MFAVRRDINATALERFAIDRFACTHSSRRTQRIREQDRLFWIRMQDNQNRRRQIRRQCTNNFNQRRRAANRRAYDDDVADDVQSLSGHKAEAAAPSSATPPTAASQLRFLFAQTCRLKLRERESNRPCVP